jgi:hypothetical protein
MVGFPDWARGRVRVISADGTAAAESIDVTPGGGGKWLVLALWGAHNDNAAARDCAWSLIDSVGSTTVVFPTQSCAIGILRSIYSLDTAAGLIHHFPHPFVLSPTVSARFTVTAVGATKVAYYRGVVIELQGVSDLSG